MFDRHAPRWLTIPPHRPFLADLAVALLREAGDDRVILADALVLLPTRRACRLLGEAFLEQAGGRAVILPQIRTLGDLDEGEPPFEPGDLALELPPAIDGARRRFELAGLVARHQHLIGRSLDAEGALELADALGGFLDAWEIEERDDPDAVAGLAGAELARHWEMSAVFLDLALTAWPARLAELGLIDPQERQTRLLRALAGRWRAREPAGPVVIAGSTGARPAVADLMAVAAGLAAGAVVLPGLDLSLAASAWDAVGEGHPQAVMKRLLQRVGLGREAVVPLDPAREGEAARRWRRRLVGEALRPPAATADWLPQIEALRAEGAAAGLDDALAVALEGLTFVSAREPEEAAVVAALLMRETLETPGRTCALITPDVDLARRAGARLRRWGIEADVSAGRPLAEAPAAVLAALLVRAVADPMDPGLLLALAKHPLAAFDLPPDRLAAARRTLERRALRGPRPPHWDGLVQRLRASNEAGAAPGEPDPGALALARVLQAVIETAAAPFADGAAAPGEAARALALGLEALAGQAPWQGVAGEALARLLAGLMEASGALPQVTLRGFADLLEGLLAREVLRSGAPAHPRLAILGVLEARLTQADRLILAGLEEGVWPAAAPADPFLSRPMRERLGLPPPERRIGLSAHDFAQAACGPEVVLLSTERRGGAPAVASRWLWRLSTLICGADLQPPSRPELLAWARALDAPLAEPPPALAPAARPAPRPPLQARPRELPVTAVERWVRDPYALYAQRILRLRPLDPPDAPIDALARGQAVHAAFEAFARDHPGELPPDAESRFTRLLVEALQAVGFTQAAMAREQALAASLARWVVDFESGRRDGARLLVETAGRLEIVTPGGPFVLTARADRLEVRGTRVDVLDFKTGQPASQPQVAQGLAPQLTLTAAILAAGGFPGLGPLEPRELAYVRVSGGRIPGRFEERARGAAADLASQALDGLRRRVAAFDQPHTPYVSRVAMQFARGPGDYDHLARVWEWAVVGAAGDEP